MPLPCWRRHSIRSVDVDSDPRPDLIQTLYASRAWISDRSGSTALQSNDALCTSVLLTHLQPLAFQARQLVSAPDIFTSLAHSIRTPCRRTRSTLRDLDEQACRSPWLQTSSPLRSCACSPFAHSPLLPLTCQGDAVCAPVQLNDYSLHTFSPSAKAQPVITLRRQSFRPILSETGPTVSHSCANDLAGYKHTYRMSEISIQY